eukprot:4731367-Alexandrium_andersonii.AAC.1
MEPAAAQGRGRAPAASADACGPAPAAAAPSGCCARRSTRSPRTGRPTSACGGPCARAGRARD